MPVLPQTPGEGVQPDGYDARRDVEGSFAEAYRAIRERVAAGGPGWMPSSLPGRLTRTNWQLPDGLPLEAWKRCGAALQQIEGSLQWWLGDWWVYGEHAYGERVQALEPGGPLEGMNFQTCMQYGWVARKIEASRRREVVSFTHHIEVAALSPDQQDFWLNLVEQEGISVAQLRERIREAAHSYALPAGGGVTDDLWRLINAGQKFSVIYADPPWTFEVYSGKGKRRSAERHYPTMTLETIKALPVEKLANDDCALLLWAVMPQLPEALEVIKAWGFTYKTVGFTWVKQNRSGHGLFTGMGYWTRSNAELCLLATRGSPKRRARNVPQVMLSPVGSHSRKPQKIAERIERLLPGPYLEMFARERMDGWEVWGNSVMPTLFHQSIGEFDGR